MAQSNRKQRTDIHITGVHMTEQRRDLVHSRLMAALSITLNGELDGVTITFAGDDDE